MPKLIETAKAEVQALVKDLKKQGLGIEERGHVLIIEGLCELAENLCAEHLIEQLNFVRKEIDEKIASIKQEAN